MANELVNIHRRLVSAVTSEKNKRVALTTTLAIQKSRIFSQGKDSDGSKIGNYSTKPISISKKNQARNTGQTKFPGGYAEYKNKIGKGGTVNFRNTDQMMMDYGLVTNGQTFGFGFQNQENYNKSQWLQDKFDKDVFELDEKELTTFTDVLVDQLNKSL